jgi:hypothetical protein
MTILDSQHAAARKRSDQLEVEAHLSESTFDAALAIRRVLDDTWWELNPTGIKRKDFDKRVLKLARKKF